LSWKSPTAASTAATSTMWVSGFPAVSLLATAWITPSTTVTFRRFAFSMKADFGRAPDSNLLAILVEINHEITSILDLDQLLKKSAELTARIVPYEIFAIFLVDDAAQELYYRFAIGHSKETVRTLRVAFGEGIVGAAAQERKPVVVDDVRTDPRYIEAVKAA